MAQEVKLRLAHWRRRQIRRLLVTWYGHLERGPVPARLQDLISHWQSAARQYSSAPTFDSVSEPASEQNLRR